MCKLHDFFAIFPPADKKSKSSIVATSVLGHVMSTDFDSRDNCTVSPETLFRARTVKQFEESTVDLGIAEHLIAAADDCDYLYLWLDCDNEDAPRTDFAGMVGAGPSGTAACDNSENKSSKVLRPRGESTADPVPRSVLYDGVGSRFGPLCCPPGRW